MDWKAIVASVAPTIATALGGPLAGLAVKAIGGALLGTDTASETDVAAAVAGATPEHLLALKQADAAFAVKMRELDIDLERVNAADRDSARKMQTETGSKVPGILAMLITAGFFGVLMWMLKFGIPKEAGGSEAMLVMLGSLGTAWTAVVGFYFGSSHGAAQAMRQAAAK